MKQGGADGLGCAIVFAEDLAAGVKAAVIQGEMEVATALGGVPHSVLGEVSLAPEEAPWDLYLTIYQGHLVPPQGAYIGRIVVQEGYLTVAIDLLAESHCWILCLCEHSSIPSPTGQACVEFVTRMGPARARGCALA